MWLCHQTCTSCHLVYKHAKGTRDPLMMTLWSPSAKLCVAILWILLHTYVVLHNKVHEWWHWVTTLHHSVAGSNTQVCDTHTLTSSYVVNVTLTWSSVVLETESGNSCSSSCAWEGRESNSEQLRLQYKCMCTLLWASNLRLEGLERPNSLRQACNGYCSLASDSTTAEQKDICSSSSYQCTELPLPMLPFPDNDNHEQYNTEHYSNYLLSPHKIIGRSGAKS